MTLKNYCLLLHVKISLVPEDPDIVATPKVMEFQGGAQYYQWEN